MKKLEASDKVDYDVKARFQRPKYVNIELDCGEYKTPNGEDGEDFEPEDEFYEDAFGDGGFTSPPLDTKLKKEPVVETILTDRDNWGIYLCFNVFM